MKTLKIEYNEFNLKEFYKYMVENSSRFLGGNEDEMVLCADDSGYLDYEICEGFKFEDFENLLKEGEYSLAFTLGCIDDNNVIELISGDKYQVKYSTYMIKDGEKIYEHTDGISEGDLSLGMDDCAVCLSIKYKFEHIYISTVKIHCGSCCSPGSIEKIENCGDIDLYAKALLNNFIKEQHLDEDLETDRQIKIDYGIGFVFDNSKLVVIHPVGSTISSELGYNIDNEISFLSGGPQFAFPSDAVGMAYSNMEMIQSHLGRPHNEFAFIIDFKDNKTQESISVIKDEFMKKYTVLDEYVKKGYDIKSVCYVENNIEKYALNEERLEKLNILKINVDEFCLEDLINKIKENMADDIDEDSMIMNLRKSNLVDYIYVCNQVDEENTTELVNRVINSNDKIYVPFAKVSEWGMEVENAIACANGMVIGEDDDIDNIDMGSLNIGDIFEVGILIECNNKVLTFKVVNYISQTPAGQTLIQIVEDTGIFKELITEFINGYVKVID